MLKFYFQALFQSAQQLYEKREGSGYGFVSLTNGFESGRPKKPADPDPQHCLISRTVGNEVCCLYRSIANKRRVGVVVKLNFRCKYTVNTA